MTPLHYAARYNHVAVAEVLVEHGAGDELVISKCVVQLPVLGSSVDVSTLHPWSILYFGIKVIQPTSNRLVVL